MDMTISRHVNLDLTVAEAQALTHLIANLTSDIEIQMLHLNEEERAIIDNLFDLLEAEYHKEIMEWVDQEHEEEIPEETHG